MELDKRTHNEKFPIYHGSSTYSTTGLISIVTQAIANENRKEGTVRQELGLGGSRSIAKSNSALLRGIWARNMHCPQVVQVPGKIFPYPKENIHTLKNKNKSFRTNGCQVSP